MSVSIQKSKSFDYSTLYCFSCLQFDFEETQNVWQTYFSIHKSMFFLFILKIGKIVSMFRSICFMNCCWTTFRIFRIKRKNIYTKIEVCLPFILCLYKIDLYLADTIHYWIIKVFKYFHRNHQGLRNHSSNFERTWTNLKCMLWEDPNFIQYMVDLSKGVRAYECIDSMDWEIGPEIIFC